MAPVRVLFLINTDSFRNVTTHAAARLRATRAVLGYVQSVAAALPEVGRSLWAMGR